MHRLRYRAAAAAAGAAAGAAAAFMFGGPASTNYPAQTRPSAAKSVPYDLYTHCGITEARVGNRFFVAVRPLSDGAGNPPAGWGNPYQPGTMTLVSPAEAVFTDSAGHRVVFRARPGAKTFLRACS
ncbi:MAG TPA: hypothetical protein VKV38_17210 [Trebonia sp.]|nr:hypothetical protein [Trebonia sp.]